VEPEAHEQVEAVLQELGATMLPFRVASKGLSVQRQTVFSQVR
jgi:hypothetical protein